MKHVEDILDFFSKKYVNIFVLPTFTASGLVSAPFSGFGPIVHVIMAIIVEIAYLKAEVSEYRKTVQCVVHSMELVVTIK